MRHSRLPGSGCDEAFLNRAAHDVRACFRAGRTLPDWVAEDLEAAGFQVPDAVAEHLELMKIQGARGDRLVRDLCEFVLAGQRVDAAEQVPCDWLFDTCARRVVPQGWQVGIACGNESVTASGDALQRVVGIVLDNAVRHHDDAKGRIWLSASSSETTVALRIDDDGPGVAEANRARIFEPLITLQSRDTREGSGLGLAIARQTVSLMGGQILAGERPEGRGLRVTVTLPRQ